MNRKHMPLMVGGAVVLLLVVALAFLLVVKSGAYSESTAGLSAAQMQLQRLSTRSVFPSDANVQTMGKQLEIYREYREGLLADMRKDQRPAQAIDRDGFRRVLEDGLRRLVSDARAKSVALAPGLAFGVQRYIEGAPPSDEELPRLVDQFSSIADLCEVLYDAGIGELVSIERTVFEKDAQTAPVEEEGGRRGLRGRGEVAPAAAAASTELYRDPDGLFTREHYVLAYRAQDAANWKVLDRLSQGAPFAVVTKMEIANPSRPAVVVPKTEEAPAPASAPVSTEGWQSAGPAGRLAGAAKEETVLPRELRVVAGQELSNVRLEVDLYRFAEADAAPAAGEGEVQP